ncbi:MAG: transporter [Halieaceae bacterium]
MKDKVFLPIGVLAFVAMMGLVGRVFAAEGGYSNYVPGTYGDFGMALAPADSWTLRNDTYYYGAEIDESLRSGALQLDTDLDFLMNFTTLLYKPDFELFGGQYAGGIFMPIVSLDIKTDIDLNGLDFETDDSASGLGDIALIPLALYWQNDNYYWSLLHLIVAPTGDYDIDNPINASLNYWSFDTNVAFTYLNPETGKDLSFNLGYIYNTENDDTDYQTGQELHLDFAFNQFFSDTFALGLQGFYLKQFTGDSGDGAVLGDFKAEAAGIGPAALWSTNIGDQNVTFIAKWLHEFHAENRVEGDHIFFSFAMDW